MKPAPFDYLAPDTIDDAIAALAEFGPDARVLAGGQSLVPLMNDRRVRPSVLIDINRVPGLAHVDDGEARTHPGSSAAESHRVASDAFTLHLPAREVVVGASVRQSAGEGLHPLLDLALPHVGHRHTRNRGTIAGCVAHGDPLAEVPLALAVAGGSVLLESTRGRRRVAVADLLDSAFAPAIASDELVVATVWPSVEPTFSHGFVELAAGTTVVAAAASVQLGGGYGVRVGVAGPEDRAVVVEVDLLFGDEDLAPVREAVAEAVADIGFVEDPAAPAHYRRAVSPEIAVRAVADAFSRQREVAA